MTYLSRSGGLYGPTEPIYPSSYPTGDYCNCGRRKAPGDFLCDECREDLDAHYAPVSSHPRCVNRTGRQTCCEVCHECGGDLSRVLDGELWCAECEAYR